MRYAAPVSFALFALALCGCPANKPAATFESKPDEHDHVHERDNMKFEDAGPYHAGLTAHLSQKEGNELDIFFETVAQPAKPAPVDMKNFKAIAKTADGKQHNLTFEPAPKDERKDDPEGKCSHYVAKAPWMKAEDVLTVTAAATINGKPTTIEWKDFNPKKYAHHIDEK
jgi:hypothetical protein